MNIKMVFEIGISAPKRIMRLSRNVRSATTTIITKMRKTSRFRRRKSSPVIVGFVSVALDLNMVKMAGQLLDLLRA